MPLLDGYPYLRAEVAYAVTHEGALHVEDVLARRIRLLIESPDAGAAAAPEVAAIMGGLLGWGRRRRALEIRRYADFAAANSEALRSPETSRKRPPRPRSRSPRSAGIPGAPSVPGAPSARTPGTCVDVRIDHQSGQRCGPRGWSMVHRPPKSAVDGPSTAFGRGGVAARRAGTPSPERGRCRIDYQRVWTMSHRPRWEGALGGGVGEGVRTGAGARPGQAAPLQLLQSGYKRYIRHPDSRKASDRSGVADGSQSLHGPWQRHRRAAGRADRGGRRRADDADADPAVQRQAGRGDLQRPRRRRGDAAGRARWCTCAGTVNFRLVGWMCAGSVPMAFLGAYLLHLLGGGSARSRTWRSRSARRCSPAPPRWCCAPGWTGGRGSSAPGPSRRCGSSPLPTIAIGAVGGLIVGMTSVGSGSLMIVLLLFTYPALAAGQLVGTDLTQAVPLTAAAALGALLFGHVQFGLTTAVDHRVACPPCSSARSCPRGRRTSTSGRSSPS